MHTREPLCPGMTWWTIRTPRGVRLILELPPINASGLALEFELLGGVGRTLWSWRTERGTMLAVIARRRGLRLRPP